jgi:hypothetical protein
MSVYVDDATISATVGRHTSRWSHLTADSRDELHAFAERLGLQRSYFQPGSAMANPGSFSAEGWHYDLTEPKREQALRLGAVPVTTTELNAVILMRAPATLVRRARNTRERGEGDKICDWPPPGCGDPVWFQPTASGRPQVVDADGVDHHVTCAAWLAKVVADRAAKRRRVAAADAARPTLF